MSGVPDKVNILRENMLFYTPPTSKKERERVNLGLGAYLEIRIVFWGGGGIQIFFSWGRSNISAPEAQIYEKKI